MSGSAGGSYLSFKDKTVLSRSRGVVNGRDAVALAGVDFDASVASDFTPGSLRVTSQGHVEASTHGRRLKYDLPQVVDRCCLFNFLSIFLLPIYIVKYFFTR